MTTDLMLHLTLLLGFARQTRMVHPIIASVYLPESGENQHGTLLQEGVGKQEEKKKESRTFLPIHTPTLLTVTAAADFNVM